MTLIFWRRIVFQAAFGMLLALCWHASPATVALAEEYLSGAPFQKALDQSLGRAWTGDSLRDALRELSRTRKVAILLDRRIDPTRELSLSPPTVPLRELIARVADLVGASTTTIGNVVYVGPKASADRLRVLVELRGKELAHLGKAAAPMKGAKDSKNSWQTRFVRLKDQRTFAWEDLDSPGELLKQIAEKNQIEIVVLDQLPHDLWAGNSLPQVTAVEALSLVLVQFDSTFEFLPDRAAVRIVPIPPPEEAVVEATYAIPLNSADKVRTLREKFPKATIEQNGIKLTVRASADQHTAIAEFLKPASSKPLASSKSTKPGNKRSEKPSPLNQTYTLTVKNAPLLEVMKTFEAKGVRFDYDRGQLQTAQLSLDRKVNIDVTGTTAETIFRDLLEPLGFQVTINGDTLRLRPKD
ncbi:MAG TPA: STN domain-containing protein [Planctomycetaceae bacterium]|nr:STN domain-containing protein [Planctomycetaceae bacterium]